MNHLHPQIFSITIPRLNVKTDALYIVLPLVALLLGPIIAFLSQRVLGALQNLRESQYLLRSEKPRLAATIEREVTRDISKAGTIRLAFIDAYIVLEKLLRKLALTKQVTRDRVRAREVAQALAARGIISESFVQRFLDVTQLRNLIVHGRDAPLDAVRAGLSGALELREELLALYPNLR